MEATLEFKGSKKVKVQSEDASVCIGKEHKQKSLKSKYFKAETTLLLLYNYESPCSWQTDANNKYIAISRIVQGLRKLLM